ncbi:MAG: hypothetical protein MRQ09_05270 [Candidatus Midichloria sp.]|nr:hypothetical protein [Candidatus Midichloria sp.]
MNGIKGFTITDEVITQGIKENYHAEQCTVVSGDFDGNGQAGYYYCGKLC